MGLAFNIFISSIGLFYFIYGKKEQEYSFLLFGIALMIYPYFLTDLVLSLVVGTILAVGPFITRRFY